MSRVPWLPAMLSFVVVVVVAVVGIASPSAVATEQCSLPWVIQRQDEVGLVYWALEHADDPCVLVNMDNLTLTEPLSLSRDVTAFLGPANNGSHLDIHYTGAGSPISVTEGQLMLAGSVSLGFQRNTSSIQGDGESDDSAGVAAAFGFLFGITLLALIVVSARWWQSWHGPALSQRNLEAKARQRFSCVVEDTELASASHSGNAGNLSLLERVSASIRLDTCEVRGEPWDLFRGTFVKNFVPLYIKRANKQHARDEEVMEELLLEAQLMTMLDTAYVAQFYGYVFTQCHGISLLYAHSSGGTLRMALQNLKADAGLSPRLGKALRCLHGVAKAVQYLHSLGIVHGGLSADAVYVKPALSRPRLAGFCPCSETLDDAQLLQPASAPRIKWMAPECVAEGRVTTAGDVFSFGVLCWEVFSEGAHPFEGTPGTQAYAKHLRGERLSQPDVCPGDAYAIISHAWQGDPAQRPTAAVLAEDLDRALACLADRGQVERPRTDEDDEEDNMPMPPPSSLRRSHGNKPKGFFQRFSFRPPGYSVSSEEHGTAARQAKPRWSDTYGLDVISESQDTNASSASFLSSQATGTLGASATAQQLEGGGGVTQREMLHPPSFPPRGAKAVSDDESTTSEQQPRVWDSFVLADEAEERERAAQSVDTEADARVDVDLAPVGYIEIESAEAQTPAAANEVSPRQAAQPRSDGVSEHAWGDREPYYVQPRSSSSSTDPNGTLPTIGANRGATEKLTTVDVTPAGLPPPRTNAWAATHHGTPGGQVYEDVNCFGKTEQPRYEPLDAVQPVGHHKETPAVSVMEDAGIYERVEAVGQRKVGMPPLPPRPEHSEPSSDAPPPLPPKGAPPGMALPPKPRAAGDTRGQPQQPVYEEPVATLEK